MLVQLISILHGQTKLPTLFRAVGFLWKVNVLFGQELPLALDSMPCTVEAEKKGLNSEGGVEREREIYARCLKRYVDTWREGVRDVVTQHTVLPPSSAVRRAPSPHTARAPGASRTTKGIHHAARMATARSHASPCCRPVVSLIAVDAAHVLRDVVRAHRAGLPRCTRSILRVCRAQGRHARVRRRYERVVHNPRIRRHGGVLFSVGVRRVK